MSEAIKKRTVFVGLFLAIGLLFLVGGIMTIGNIHSTFSKKLTISSVFNNVNGLQAGNNIWFSGVKVGTVKKTEFYGQSQVKVIMNINNDSKAYIRQDAAVKISSDGLIGNKILVIYGGSTKANEVTEGDVLANEQMLSADDIMATLQQNNLNLLKLTNKISNGEGSLGKLINSDSFYNNLLVTSHSLKEASVHAQILISSLSLFGSRLNQKGNLANDLVNDTIVFKSLKASVLNLHQVTDSASLFVNNLKSAINNPNTPVGLILNDEPTATNVKVIIANLKTGSETLNKDLEAVQHSFLLKGFFNKNEKKKKK